MIPNKLNERIFQLIWLLTVWYDLWIADVFNEFICPNYYVVLDRWCDRLILSAVNRVSRPLTIIDQEDIACKFFPKPSRTTSQIPKVDGRDWLVLSLLRVV